MGIRVLRIAMAVLALVSLVVFVLEIRSSRNDATYIAQASFVIFLILAGLGWRAGRNRSGGK